MKIKEMELEQLIPYEKNPRKNDEAVQYVANSIKQFGFKVPIVIDKNNVIVCGHTRYKASKELGLKTVPCVIADDLTDEQIRAYRIADNKVSEKSEWDLGLLKMEFEQIDLDEIDMSALGFGDFEITSLTNDFTPDAYDEDILAEYSGAGDTYLATKRVMITYTEDQEEALARLLGVEQLKVVYRFEELPQNENNSN